MLTWQQARRLKNEGNPADIPPITLGETIVRIRTLIKEVSSSDAVVIEMELDLIARELEHLREHGEIVTPPAPPSPQRRPRPKSMKYELTQDEAPW